MRKEDFDWKGGKVVLWQLDALAADAARDEDLAHVEFGAAVVLDVTWQPEPAGEGRFVVQVVKNQHWEEPSLRVECTDVDSLALAIGAAIDAATKARGRN